MSTGKAKDIAREAEKQLIAREGWHKASPDELKLAEYSVNLTLEEACKACRKLGVEFAKRGATDAAVGADECESEIRAMMEEQ